MLALATLAGCASAPAPKPLEVHWELPENWSVARATDAVDVAGAGSLWWVELGAEPLAELVAEALTFNYDLRAAASRLGAAAAQARIAGAPLIPQLQAAGTGTRRRQNFIGFPIPGREQEALTTTSSNYGVSLNLSWELDLWGRLRAGPAAALADLMAAAAVLRGARLSLVAQTARVYFACLEARRQVELADATMENQQLSARQVEARYERGLRPSLDVRLGRSSAAAAEAVLRQRQRQLDLVTRQLELLLGRYPRAVLQLEADLPPAPPPIPVGLPADLIGRRPDLVAAERHLAAAGQMRKAAKSALAAWARNPHPDLAAAYGALGGADEAPLDRVRRFQSLYKLRPDDAESRLALAEASLAAALWGEARRHLAVTGPPSARHCRLMAALEDQEFGNTEAARRWLDKAAAALPEKAWICGECRSRASAWTPACDHCNAFDGLAWRLPPGTLTSASAKVAVAP